eukprot:5788003-Karenia_brevis.AAC.1
MAAAAVRAIQQMDVDEAGGGSRPKLQSANLNAELLCIKRIGAPSSQIIKCIERPRPISANQLFCSCGADLGGGKKIEEELFDRQKEKAINTITR